MATKWGANQTLAQEKAGNRVPSLSFRRLCGQKEPEEQDAVGRREPTVELSEDDAFGEEEYRTGDHREKE